MNDPDIFKAVLHVAENSSTTNEEPRRVDAEKVKSRLADLHGYDEDSAQLLQQLAATFKKWNGKLWRYHTTDQDGIPDTVLVPEATLEDFQELAE